MFPNAFASEVQGERRAETRSSYAEPQPSLAVASQMQWQRYDISKGCCPSLADSEERKSEIMWNVSHRHPLTIEIGCFLQFPDKSLIDWRHVHNLLVLQLGLRRKQLGFWRDAHLVEDVAAGCQIATEGSFRDAGEFGEFLLADEKMFVVVINHKFYFKGILLGNLGGRCSGLFGWGWRCLLGGGRW